MTTLFEVKTGHTEKVVKALVRFMSEKRSDSKKIMVKYLMLIALFFMLPRALNMPMCGYVICWLIGVLIVVMALMKDHLTYLNTIRQDKYYIERTEIVMTFGHEGFEVQDEEKKFYKYHLINHIYTDGEMLFLIVEEGDVYVVPKEDLTMGDPDEFCRFLEMSANKKIEQVSLTFRQKYFGK